MVFESDDEKVQSVAKLAKIDKEARNILQEFEFVKVLNENPLSKTIFIHARKTSNDESKDAVLIFEKPHFGLDEVKSLFNVNNELDLDIKNDIYQKMSVYPTKPFNNVQVQLIYPATESHIAKYSMQEMFFVRESPEDWLNITSKYINESAFDNQWVYNILDHKSEKERIIFEDSDETDGFILVPDIRWDSRVVDNLYVLAICRRKDIRCVRDLDSSHLSLLENMRAKSLQAIADKFNIPKSHVRAFVHYQPSFYHLHVHFSHIKSQLPGIAERNYALNNVIESLRVDSDYFRKVTLEFVVKSNEKLYKLFKHKIE